MAAAFSGAEHSKVNSAYTQNNVSTKGKGFPAFLLLFMLLVHFMHSGVLL